jgi:iron(III) transport system substrate-binding protein
MAPETPHLLYFCSTTKEVFMVKYLLSLFLAVILTSGVMPRVANAGSESDASWKTEWERVVGQAKKEGTVAVKGPPGAKVRRVLTGAFEKAFPGITVEFEGGRGGELAAKLIREREADLFSTDVWIGGLGTQLSLLKPQGVQEPIEPALILPDVKDPKVWIHDRLEFADKEGKYVLVFVNQSGTLMAYNTNLVKPEEVPTSLHDLLKPKWKGKLIMVDPTTSGPGRGMFTWVYKEVGAEFIRELGKQKPVITRDRRGAIERIVRGAYPIGIAISNLDAKPFQNVKAPIKLIWNVKEGSYASASYGGLALVSKAPHINAAKVYINWLLGKEGQTLLAEAAGWASSRRDVPAEDPDSVLKPDVKYFRVYTEQNAFLYKSDGYRKLMKEAFGLRKR